MYSYEFIGFRKYKGDIFYINGVNISDKTWFNTGKCVTVKLDENSNYHMASVYYIKIREKQKLYFAVVNIKGKEAIFARIKDGVREVGT